MEVAEEVCGVIERQEENPWMVGKEEEIQRLRGRVNAAL